MSDNSNDTSPVEKGSSKLARPVHWPRFDLLLTCCLLGVFLAGLGYFFTADLPQYVDARGVLMPRGGMEPIIPVQSGVVMSMSAKEGQNVSKGDVLLRFRPDISSVVPSSTSGDELVSLMATTDGRIAKIRTGIGGPIRPGDWVILVLRPESEFSAMVYVSSQRIANFRVNGEVSIMLDTMPRFGSTEISGRISKLSVLPRSPEEVGRYFPLKEPAYEVVVDFSRSQLSTSTANDVLKPGAMLTASALVERRSVGNWLVQKASQSR